MENVMANNFEELTLDETLDMQGGTDMNEAVHDLFATIGAGVAHAYKGLKWHFSGGTGYWLYDKFN